MAKKSQIQPHGRVRTSNKKVTNWYEMIWSIHNFSHNKEIVHAYMGFVIVVIVVV